MEATEMFAACTQMRRATADWLESLDDQELDTQSLCAHWRVRDVAGHLLAPLTTTIAGLLWNAAKNGFSLDRANTAMARSLGARPVVEVAGAIREHAAVELDVPFVGAHGPFTDLLVHNADMRVPLDAPWQPETAWAVEALAFVADGAVGFAGRRRLAGLRICASDAGISLGSGAELRGPAYSLLLALCGRRAGLDSLDGPGVEVLSART